MPWLDSTGTVPPGSPFPTRVFLHFCVPFEFFGWRLTIHMNATEILLLGLTSFFSSTLTAMIGFGGGTILIGIMLIFLPPAATIPFHGLVQLISNGWRVTLFRHHIQWDIVWRFALLLPIGVAIGMWFIQGLSPELIQILIGVFVLFALVSRQLKGLRQKDLPLWAFIPLGLVVGVLNMMVGVVAPLLGVLVIRREMNKESVIGTMGFMATSGHLVKVAAFILAGFSFRPYLPALAVMLPAVMLGGVMGKWLLGRFNENIFRVLFQLVLLFLSMKLIIWEGLLRIWP